MICCLHTICFEGVIGFLWNLHGRLITEICCLYSNGNEIHSYLMVLHLQKAWMLTRSKINFHRKTFWCVQFEYQIQTDQYSSVSLLHAHYMYLYLSNKLTIELWSLTAHNSNKLPDWEQKARLGGVFCLTCSCPIC